MITAREEKTKDQHTKREQVSFEFEKLGFVCHKPESEAQRAEVQFVLGNMKKVLRPRKYFLKLKEIKHSTSRQMREGLRGSEQKSGQNALA